ncbi:MAG: RNA 2',3'-cyclic phosphodiesterase [Acidimicrobiales bacterium]|nr:MAG: RNA 2',3'-cyclic phosphodiesterase [Acidimicrobiales bacterium]
MTPTIPDAGGKSESAGSDSWAEKTARMFVAVLLPEKVADLIEAIARPMVPGVRWTRRDQWHVTLRFLGKAEIDEVQTALSGLQHERVLVRLGPRVERLGRHVVALPAEGLEALAARVSELTAHLGKPPERRPFMGHVTLARVKGGRLPLVGTELSAEFVAEAVFLMRSRLSPAGAHYEPLQKIALGPSTQGHQAGQPSRSSRRAAEFMQ